MSFDKGKEINAKMKLMKYGHARIRAIAAWKIKFSKRAHTTEKTNANYFPVSQVPNGDIFHIHVRPIYNIRAYISTSIMRTNIFQIEKWKEVCMMIDKSK